MDNSAAYHGMGSFKLIPVLNNKKQQDKGGRHRHIQVVINTEIQIKSNDKNAAANGEVRRPRL